MPPETKIHKTQIPMYQPLISWKKCHFSSFYNTGVTLTVIALLYILCKYTCAYFKNIDINTYSAHVYDYTLNISHSDQGSKCPSLPGLTHWVNPGLPGLGFKPYFGKVGNAGE